jgi:hypothetical protein
MYDCVSKKKKKVLKNKKSSGWGGSSVTACKILGSIPNTKANKQKPQNVRGKKDDYERS